MYVGACVGVCVRFCWQDAYVMLCCLATQIHAAVVMMPVYVCFSFYCVAHVYNRVSLVSKMQCMIFDVRVCKHITAL